MVKQINAKYAEKKEKERLKEIEKESKKLEKRQKMKAAGGKGTVDADSDEVEEIGDDE